MGTYTPSEEERENGLHRVQMLRRQLRAKDAADTLAAPPVEQPEPVPHEPEACPYCTRARCWACEQDGRPMTDCRHELPARHGGGDLTNPEPPEKPADETEAEEAPMPEEPTDG